MESTLNRISNAHLRSEARLLFTLLDAAESANLIADAGAKESWREIKTRLNGGGSYKNEAENMFDCLYALEASAAFVGTWIEERWQVIQSRAAKMI